MIGFTDVFRRRVWAMAWICALEMCIGAPAFAATGPATAPVSFRREIAPVLVERCVKCHGAEKSKGKFRLDSFERMKKPGESKANPLVAGKPEESEIYRLITAADEEDRMPKKSEPLPPGQVALIRAWVQQGAKFD